jgi:cysteine-rich repeat protein
MALRARVARVLFTLIVSAMARDASAVIVADHANDVCGPAVDPCVITQTVVVVSGSILDFGTRALRVQGAGEIDVDGGTARIRAGSLTVTVSGTGIKLNEGTIGGLLTVEAYGTCSGNAAVRCLNDMACTGVGSCTGGSGDVSLGGRTVGSAEVGSSFVVRAAGDVNIVERILLEGNTFIADGGSVDIQAGGDLFVDEMVVVNSGGEGTGGEITLTAGRDLFVRDGLDALGGDFDGGTISLVSGRDILVTAGVNADANTGEGFGGSIELDAGRNIEVIGGTSLNNLFLTTEGHTGYDGNVAFAGDGGYQDYIAEGSISFGPFVRLRANGAAPDGSGDEIAIYATGPLTISGTVESITRGALGAGGFLDLSSDDALTLTSTSALEVLGGESGGGEVIVFARGNVTVGGLIDASATNTGIGGLIELESELKLAVSGDIANDGDSFGAAVGLNSLSGCQIDVLSGGSIANPAPGGRNNFFVADLMKVFAGASVTAGAGGQNRIQHRDAGVPPVILGTVSPAAITTVNANLPSCPLCGNGSVNLGETCDDANLIGGDGCSAECQNEGCIAGTPGYPSVALCYDANPCTLDRCDSATSACVHETSCDDGYACTVDECLSGSCVHTPSNALCEDGNECTSQSCGATSGCTILAVSGACDDELYCNGTDACLGGGCGAHTGDPCAGMSECLDVCNELTDECRASFGYPCSTDSNGCTDDICSGLGTCLHINNANPCENGVFCDGADFCNAGTCSVSVGNPCDAGSDCAHTCDEGAAICTADVGEPCTDDGNVCTDDSCDGEGACLHPANTAPCDDGDICTQADTCAAGTCSANDRVGFTSVRLTGSRKPLANDDRLTIKAAATTANLSQSPLDGGVLLSLRDEAGTEIWVAYLPGNTIIDQGGRGTTFKFKDNDGAVATANGVSSATFKRVASAGTVRIGVKARGLELPSFTAIDSVDLSVLVGNDAIQGDCLSSLAIECPTSSTTALRCAN